MLARIVKLSCLPLLLIAVLVVATGFAPPQAKAPPTIDAASLATMLQSANKIEKLEHDWGWLQWLMNDKLDADSEMTFGLVQINAGESNPTHVHPNCEEHLYVLSGSCKHWIGDEMVILKAGDLLRIPTGVPHAAAVVGDEPMQAVIVYSSGDRQFVLVED